MSSNTTQVKKRRLQGACDVCRQKKIKCDSATRLGNRCSNCISFNDECTHTTPIKKRGPKSGYVERLESRIVKLEEMLQLQSEPNFLQTSGSASQQQSARSPTSPSVGGSTLPVKEEPDETDLEHLRLAEHFKNLDLATINKRFFGPSSGFHLINKLIDDENELTGEAESRELFRLRRQKYWTIPFWEQVASERRTPQYQYPESDLLDRLVDTYFSTVHLFIPILHEEMFRNALREGMHLNHSQFGATVLLVCALGARFIDDPRVYVEGDESELSGGWKYFVQVQMLPKSLFEAPSLCDMQFYCLATLFSLGSSTPQATWTFLGLAVRFAQDMGLHRRPPHSRPFTAEDELKKRTFWAIISIDRLVSSFLGRPLAMRDDDFDIDYPVECDDPYWRTDELGAVTFIQPSDKPPYISFFRCHLMLCGILSSALTVLYPTKKYKPPSGDRGQWERGAVASLDSALNDWIDQVPTHLRWDPTNENTLFLTQSGMLHAIYYLVQIQIHRPFIHKMSSLSFPSFAICANAARSCSHVLGVYSKRTDFILPHVIMAAFMAGGMLLLGIRRGQRIGMVVNASKELENVQECLDVLASAERRWTIAGRLWDILHELASMGSINLQEQTSKKRTREEDAVADDMFTPLPLYSSDLESLGADSVAFESMQQAAEEELREWCSFFDGLDQLFRDVS